MGILEGPDLCGCGRAVLLREKNIVILIRLKRGIEVDEIYGLVFDMQAEHIKVVAIIETIRHSAKGHPSPAAERCNVHANSRGFFGAQNWMG